MEFFLSIRVLPYDIPLKPFNGACVMINKSVCRSGIAAIFDSVTRWTFLSSLWRGNYILLFWKPLNLQSVYLSYNPFNWRSWIDCLFLFQPITLIIKILIDWKLEGADVSGTSYQSERWLGNYQYATREELSIIVIYTALNEMRFHKNAFPRKAFQQKAFKQMLSTKCRKSTLGKK